MVSAATVPTPTSFMLAGVLVPTALVVCARRRTWLWTVSVIVSLAVGLLCSPHVWLWMACLFVLLFVDLESAVGPGEVRIRTVHIGELSVIPLAVAVAVACHPWWAEEPLKHVGLSLRDWMRVQPEPMVWFGSRYGADRIPVLATLSGPILWLPSVWTLFTLVGMTRAVLGIRRQPQRWFPSLFVLGAALVLLWSLRTMWHAGVDLRVLVVAAALPLSVSGVMWVAGALMNAGEGAQRTLQAQRGHVTGARVILAAVAVLSLIESAPAWQTAESWHSSLLGGTRGAAARGMWRNPHAPVPVEWASQWMNVSGRWVVPVNDWEWHRVLDYYVETGRMPAPVEWSSLETADVGLMVFEDAAPEFHAAWLEYDRLERAGRVLGRWLSADGTVLAAAVWLGAGEPP
jgi:hypothetical protein